MIDVDLMLEEAEKQKAMHFVMAAGFTNSEIIFMLTRLREAEKDAERYRYIKSVCEVIECTDGQYLDVIDGQELDAMIDDCIKAMKEKGDE